MKITARTLIPLFVLVLLALSAVGVASAQNFSDIAGTIRSTVTSQGVSETEITGTITSITPESWTVDGTEFGVLPLTEIKGAFVVGDVVKVHLLSTADGSLTAREIEYAETGVANDNGNDNGEFDDDNGNVNDNANGEIDDDNGNVNDNANEEIENDNGTMHDDDNGSINDNSNANDDHGNDNGADDHDNGNANDDHGNANDHHGNDNGADDHGSDNGNNHHGGDDHGGDNGNDNGG